MAKMTIDGTVYETDDFTDHAKATIGSLQFVDAQLQQLRNELAICDTARLAYGRALKRELEKVQPEAQTVTGSES